MDGSNQAPTPPQNDYEARYKGLNAKLNTDYIPKSEIGTKYLPIEEVKAKYVPVEDYTAVANSVNVAQRDLQAAREQVLSFGQTVSSLTGEKESLSQQLAGLAASQQKQEVILAVFEQDPAIARAVRKGTLVVPDGTADISAWVKSVREDLGVQSAPPVPDSQRFSGSTPPIPSAVNSPAGGEFASMSREDLSKWMTQNPLAPNWNDASIAYMKMIGK